jgi:hypothetical protein
VTLEPDILIVFAVILAMSGAVWAAGPRHAVQVPLVRAGTLWSSLQAITATTPAQLIYLPSSPIQPRKPVSLAVQPGPVAGPVARTGDSRIATTAGSTADSVNTVVAGGIMRPGNPASLSQINRLSQIVAASVETAQTAQRLQRNARQQVDAAQYALQGLRSELAAIMPVAAPLARAPNPVERHAGPVGVDDRLGTALAA